ncbi:hypothetical protein [Bacillus sp. REN3]|uniref:hypothetical protein n=1 Tax=Bacillus sp. REN3 TaxID=2802440 RepID=UPI001AED6B39|nr:hypothetical protein [Bacillus sp. REN3]
MIVGVGKEQIIEMMTEILHNLEAADKGLHESLSAMREDLLLSQSESIAEFEGLMALLESDSELFFSGLQGNAPDPGLKLELGF